MKALAQWRKPYVGHAVRVAAAATVIIGAMYVCVVVGFDLKMGNRTGTMSLCIPYNVIEPIVGLLATQNWFSYQRKGGYEDHLRKLTKNVSNAQVEMRAFLAQTSIRLNDLMSLQVEQV